MNSTQIAPADPLSLAAQLGLVSVTIPNPDSRHVRRHSLGCFEEAKVTPPKPPKIPKPPKEKKVRAEKTAASSAHCLANLQVAKKAKDTKRLSKYRRAMNGKGRMTTTEVRLALKTRSVPRKSLLALAELGHVIRHSPSGWEWISD